MEENKNLNTVPETEEQVAESKPQKIKKPKKEKLLKNEALFKKGSYSVALTAIVLVGILVVNILVSALNDRFVLEFDMTSDKENSISAENIDYIKGIDQEVEVIVCATEDVYASYSGAMAEQNYGVTIDATANDYLKQTVTLIKKYGAYNDNIKIRFVDTQSTEFTDVTSKYGINNLEFGSLIVSTAKKDGTNRYKKLGFNDIYNITEDQNSAYYGMASSSISGNNIETALTGAISYVLSDIDINVAFLTGHSSADITESYKKLLTDNNYKVEVISDAVIGSIDKEFDMLVIPAPSKDFVESEIAAISSFLDNEGKLGKSMMVFADASAKYLPDFYSYLSEWGVAIGEGILYETDSGSHAPGDPTTLISTNTGKIEDFADMACITGYNVPMEPAFETDSTKTAVSVVETLPTVAEAPKGVADWSGATDAPKSNYSTIIETTQMEYVNNEKAESRVTVFSSPFFLSSEYNESTAVSNKDISLAMADRASGAGKSDISFVSKSITNESFYESVTEGSANVIRVIFMFVLPLAVIAAGIVIFIKRRNA